MKSIINIIMVRTITFAVLNCIIQISANIDCMAQELDHLQVTWISQSPQWFGGFRYNSSDDPYRANDNSVTSGNQLGLYHGQIESSFNPIASVPVEVRFDPLHSQNAYRLRRTGQGTHYQIQQTNPFITVPFTVWDVSDPFNPRQLTIAWRDQNDNSIWDPPVGDDGIEIVLIYYKTYDPTGTTQFAMPPNVIDNEPTVGEKADIMYALSLQVLSGHSLNESIGTLLIQPSFFVKVSIDIKPGSYQNSINCQNPKEVIPVAILTTAEFDATQVDPSTVVFGWARAREMHGTFHLEDVDGDGDQDMLFHFLYSQTGIMCNEMQAMLFGKLYSGIPIYGTDSIHFVRPDPIFKGATGTHDGNDVVIYVAPNGHLAFDGTTYAQAYFPKRTLNQYIFDAGPWIGGIVDGIPTVAEVQYLSEFVPSEIGTTGQSFRIFNSSVSADRKSWPPEFSTTSGDPIIVAKAQNLVVQYNDLYGTPARDVQQPLGVEVSQRSLAYGDAYKRSALIFFWEIKNISTKPITDTYFGFWMDADIGDASDDRTSTINDMSIIWDNDFFDSTFTEKPAIIGFDFLETPGNLGVRNYTAFTNGGPNSDAHLDGLQYNFLSGTQHFETNLRWDVRSLLSTGPFNLAPGEKTAVSGALLFARVPVVTTWLETDPYTFRPDPNNPKLMQLLQLQSEVRKYYNLNLKGLGLAKQYLSGEDVIPASFELSQNFPDPFNPSTTIRFQIPYQTHVTLKVFDVLGREVALLVNEMLGAGRYDVQFDGSNLTSGVYFYHLQSANFNETKKLILLK